MTADLSPSYIVKRCLYSSRKVWRVNQIRILLLEKLNTYSAWQQRRCSVHSHRIPGPSPAIHQGRRARPLYSVSERDGWRQSVAADKAVIRQRNVPITRVIWSFLIPYPIATRVLAPQTRPGCSMERTDSSSFFMSVSSSHGLTSRVTTD